MPATQAQIGYGTVFEMADAATPTVFDYIPEIFDLTPPPIGVSQAEATHNASPGRSREFIPGLIEQQEMSFSLNYVAGGTADQLLRAAVGKSNPCRITFPNGVAMTFKGNLSGYEPDAPTDDRQTARAAFTLSGGFAVSAIAAPRNLVAPAVSGSPVVGALLEVDTGVWAGAESIAVQWQLDTDGSGTTFNDISGATDLIYVPVSGDVGKLIRAEVTGVNTGFSTIVNSAATVAVT